MCIRDRCTSPERTFSMACSTVWVLRSRIRKPMLLNRLTSLRGTATTAYASSGRGVVRPDVYKRQAHGNGKGTSTMRVTASRLLPAERQANGKRQNPIFPGTGKHPYFPPSQTTSGIWRGARPTPPHSTAAKDNPGPENGPANKPAMPGKPSPEPARNPASRPSSNTPSHASTVPQQS